MNWSTEEGVSDDDEPYGNCVKERDNDVPEKDELDGEETRDPPPDGRDRPARRGFVEAPDERHEPNDIFI